MFSIFCSSLSSIIHYIFPFVEDGQEKANEDAPENNSQYTTVYVGNLASEVLILVIAISV